MTTAVNDILRDQRTQARRRDLYSSEGAELYAAFVAHDRAEFPEIRRAAEQLGTRLRVGEIAAGEGRLLFSLDATKVDHFFALDSSPALLAALTRRAREASVEDHLETACIDVLDWQPPEGSLDLLIFGAGTVRLFTKEERRRIFELVGRALASDGVFYVSTAVPLGSEERMVCLGQMTVQNRQVVSYFYETVSSGDARETGFVLVDVFPGRKPPRTYSSTVLNVSGDLLVSELEDAGFTIKEVTTNRVDGLGAEEDLISIAACAGDQ